MLEPVNVKYFKLVVPKLKKDTPDELSGCCPVCGDTKDRLHLYWTDVGDLVHCFNSGCSLSDKHHSMKNFLDIAAPQYYEPYRRETFKGIIKTLKEETSIQDILKQAKEEKEKKAKEAQEALVPEEVKEIPLDKLFLKAKDTPECVKYLESRNIKVQDDWYFSNKKFFEYDNKMVYLLDYLLIPIYAVVNAKKKYRGFYSRSLKEKRFSTFLLPDTEKLWVQNPFVEPDIITEGIFDAISSGFDNPAAMLGAGLSREYIKDLSRDTIIATDNDETGIKKAKEFLNLGFKVFVWPDVEEKDFNDMLINGYEKNEIKEFIRLNTYHGIMGKIKLGIKEK